MITISPSVANFAALSPTADYTVTIFDTRLNMLVPKNINAARTISGGASVTVWESGVAGESRSIYKTVSQSVYDKLLRIKESGVDEWLVRSSGKVYNAVFDMTFAAKDERTGRWTCQLEFVFTGEA